MGEVAPLPTVCDSLETAQRVAALLGIDRRCYTVVTVVNLTDAASPDASGLGSHRGWLTGAAYFGQARGARGGVPTGQVRARCGPEV